MGGEADNLVHVIVLPYHWHNHINPMLQFAKRLASKGVCITLATTLSITHKMEPNMTANKLKITLHSIYDDTEEAAQNLSFKDRAEKLRSQAACNLAGLIASLLGPKPNCGRLALVYDASLPWAASVAKDRGIVASLFYTEACAFVACHYPLHVEVLGKRVPPPLPVVVPPRDVVQRGIDNCDVVPHVIKQLVLEQLETLDQADWVFFNSFDHLEPQVIKWLTNLWPVKTIGPTLPSVYLDKRVEADVNYGFNLHNPNDDACMKWLSTKGSSSVVYVSFGSIANLSVEQVVEIAEALKQSSNNFLWVVRETEQGKLPNNFVNEIDHKGLVVSWCPQLSVLAHEAVGCFVTHCGWNSTMEALSFGVPMVAMPRFLDQTINAHFIDRVWGVGIQPKVDEKGLVTCEEIRNCIGEIMQGERGNKIKESAKMWKMLAKEAIDEGGTSDKHIDEFIARLSSS